MTRIDQLIGAAELQKLRAMAKPDPKPNARIKDRAAIPRKLHRDNQCRVCGSRPHHGHHLVHKGSMRGDDVEDNIIPLCFDCHEHYHKHGPCFIRLTKKEVAYVFAKLGKTSGRDYLERRYLYTGR